MPYETYIEGNKLSLFEEVPNQLDGKFYNLVELGTTADGTVKLLATPGNEIGTVFDYLQPGQPATEVTVRLLGKGGTTKMVQSGPIPKGSKVMADPANLGQVKAVPSANGHYRSLGTKLSLGPGAAGDVIAVCDVIETIILP